MSKILVCLLQLFIVTGMPGNRRNESISPLIVHPANFHMIGYLPTDYKLLTVFIDRSQTMIQAEGK